EFASQLMQVIEALIFQVRKISASVDLFHTINSPYTARTLSPEQGIMKWFPYPVARVRLLIDGRTIPRMFVNGNEKA
ncbi:MAG: hypothetical protein JWL77_527, partial [Chthonomonadaceae bacterium]|nr:hypothetical protein [Chthonomonadaceae bacterium]